LVKSGTYPGEENVYLWSLLNIFLEN
jgi:hypothetical protein